MREAYFVVGPESSGMSLWTELLLRAGAWGQTSQRFAGRPDQIVYRKSMPSGLTWPNLHQIIQEMHKGHYDIRILVTSRDWHAMAQAQVATRHVQSLEQALCNIRYAYQIIMAVCATEGLAWTMGSYEAAIARPETYPATVLAAMSDDLLMPEIEICDGNAKYYA